MGLFPPEFGRFSVALPLPPVLPNPREVFMLWILAIVMGGLGFGYVTVRRRRKADSKTA
jgi:hypothetical protein